MGSIAAGEHTSEVVDIKHGSRTQSRFGAPGEGGVRATGCDRKVESGTYNITNGIKHDLKERT